jgi:hypothetical protein
LNGPSGLDSFTNLLTGFTGAFITELFKGYAGNFDMDVDPVH